MVIFCEIEYGITDSNLHISIEKCIDISVIEWKISGNW
jgi:hypothetical protein